MGGAGGGGDRRVTPMSGGNGAPAPGVGLAGWTHGWTLSRCHLYAVLCCVVQQQQDNAQLANFFKTLLDRGLSDPVMTHERET